MDKSSAKYSQSSSKGATADAKKSQDFTNGKLFPKTTRKREPAGTSNFPKNEQSRKCNVQKTKNFDKRPKPKGQYHGGSKEDTKVVEREVAELGSVVVHGSKKQNLNHLLNFHYEPRNVQGGSRTWSHGRSMKSYSHNGNRWLPPVQRHKYNKEQFLQASCQFVVTANGNYSLYLTDPDVLVEWKLVEQIKLYSSESLLCPICLCSPVAGKMTRCGHVYCWPCILHYLSLSDKSWCKCPICYQSVSKSDLKSVVEVTQTALNLGDTVTLRLMRREKGSLLAIPVGSVTQSPTNFFSVSEIIGKQAYSKLLTATVKDIMNIIECERVQLNVELTGDPGSPENCYIEQALLELSKREEELLQRNAEQSEDSIRVRPVSESMQEEEVSVEKEEEKVQVCQDNQEEVKVTTKEECNFADEESSSSAQSAAVLPKFFYFYQADDGQHVYLHAMNVKMLEMQYGSLENSPCIITGKLLEKEGGSLTEDLRRRLRYLCHLPLTCQFEVAEIELKPPLVSDEVLSSFRDQIALRQKRRQRRERDERKRERKITEEENKRMGKYPTPIVHIDSQRHFPQWQPEVLFAEETQSTLPESAATSSIASSPPLSTLDEPILNPATPDVNQEQGPSFAEMLRNTGSRLKAQSTWPSLHSGHSKAHLGVAQSNTDTEEEDYTLVPSYSQSFGDALAHALERTKLLEAEAKKTGDGNAGGRKKKKKGKPTVLFATTMARQS